jgi:hypothetical protein
MSYDASSLRGYLQRIDGSAPAIQGSAGAMMKHYDKSPGVAVGEWRNALIQARGDQFLPLLYVANEVLQNSKRNRGNKFLEAFSPVLGQSLIFVCAKSPPPVVESIRRTVKIWAERRVFSIRYVNELIKGLEPYRNGNGNRGGNSSPGGGQFSPVTEPPTDSQPTSSTTTTAQKDALDSDMGRSNDDQDDGMFRGNDDQQDDDDHDLDSDDDDDLFGNASKKLLKIDVDFDRASSAMSNSTGGGSAKKRRRSSKGSPGAEFVLGASSKSKRRASSQYLSASLLVELMNQVATQQASYDRVTAKLLGVHELYGDSSDANTKRIETLVGNELLEEYKNTLKHEDDINRYRRELHSIAQARRGLELEALRYLPWLERALKQDKDDIDFSNSFRKQLELFKGVYQPAKEARDRRMKEEELRVEKEEELLKKKREEEERRKFMESAMSKQTEALPGMVWNRATGEYQDRNQEESWRD